MFPTDGIRQAPISPVDGKPMRRAAIQEVSEMNSGHNEASALARF